MNSSFRRFEIIYFLGIGGIGMSALARYFHARGHMVLGYDRTPTALTTELELAGMAIHFQDSVHEIPAVVHTVPREKVLVVYTPAVPPDHRELNWFAANGYTLAKRSAVLGELTATSRTLAVAGTHGKTTTCSLLAHLLTHSGTGCTAFLGGIATNYGTNFLTDPASDLTVVEADEFDRSFLTLTPSFAAITSMDPDHLDIYGDAQHVLESFHLFARRLRQGGTLVLQERLQLDDAFSRERPDVRVFRYGEGSGADYRISDVRISGGRYRFRLSTPEGEWKDLTLGLPGRHNVWNAAAAAALALRSGMAAEHLEDGLSTFSGVARRFQLVHEQPDCVFIDDYAHHPAELEACIRSARELYPGKRLTGVFQPHLYTRTRDFADGFAQSLSLLDEVILLPIYPAREEPIKGVDSQVILDKIPLKAKKLLEKVELLDTLRSFRSGVLLTLGAGDIDQLVPAIRELLVRPAERDRHDYTTHEPDPRTSPHLPRQKPADEDGVGQ